MYVPPNRMTLTTTKKEERDEKIQEKKLKNSEIINIRRYFLLDNVFRILYYYVNATLSTDCDEEPITFSFQ